MSGTDSPLSGAAQTLLLVAVLGFSLALRSLVVDVPFERDEGQYAYIAWRWLDGAMPYVDSFDQKPPGVYAIYAAAIALFGRGPGAVHWAVGLYTLGTLAAVFAVGRRLAGPVAGLAAATLLAFLVTDRAFLANAANTETFLILPTTLAILCALRAVDRRSVGWSAASGAFGALACLVKQVAAFDLLFAGLIVLLGGADRPSIRRGAALAAGAALPVLCVGVAFAAAGALDPLLDHVVRHNLGYAGRVAWAEYPAAFLGTFGPSLSACGPIYALALAGALLAPANARAVALGWFAFAFAGVAVGGYFRHHYFLQAAPAVAVLAGAGAAAVGRLLAGDDTRRPAAAIVATAALCSVALGIGLFASRAYFFAASPMARAHLLYGTSPFHEAALVADHIAARSDPDETVFVLGSEPQIPYLAGRRSASRYILAYPLFGPYADAGDRQREALAEVIAARPAFIVVTTDPYSFSGHPGAPTDLPRGITSLLRSDYRLVARVPARARDRLEAPEPGEEDAAWAASPGFSDPFVWGTLAVFERRNRSPGP